MRTKNIYKAVLAFGLVFSTTSCHDLIDLKPTQLITDEVALKTLPDFGRALLGCYTPFRGMYIDYVSLADFVGDDVKKGSNTFGQGLQYYTMVHSSGEAEVDNIWANAYSVVNRANQIIKRLPSVATANASEEATKNRYLGEAYGLRALAHFELLRMYSKKIQGNEGDLGIPYVTEVLEPNAKPSRPTIQETLDKILADLNQAETLIYTSGSIVPTRNQLSKPAVQALKARLYLYKGDFTNAKAFADAAITSSGVGLATGSAYTGMWTDANDGEIIFRIKIEAGQGRLGYEYHQTDGDVCFFAPSNDVTSLYAATDARLGAFFDLTGFASGPVVKKHRGTSAEYGRVSFKIVRTSELYLIRAEANAQLGNEADAINDIKAIKTARISGYDPASDTDLNTATGSVLKNLIYIERRKELVYEGHRFFDLKRLSMPRVRIDCNAPGGTACTMSANADRYTFPIPQAEINANSNMKQNSGY